MCGGKGLRVLGTDACPGRLFLSSLARLGQQRRFGGDPCGQCVGCLHSCSWVTSSQRLLFRPPLTPCLNCSPHCYAISRQQQCGACCKSRSCGPRSGRLPAPRELLLLTQGSDLFCAQREKAGSDFDPRYSCTEPEPLICGKPELAQVLRAIKAMQFHQYKVLLKTKDVPTPLEDALQSQVSLAWKCILSLDLGLSSDCSAARSPESDSSQSPAHVPLNKEQEMLPEFTLSATGI